MKDIKRIACLSNDMNTIERDVPILNDLGYEIFIPKVIMSGIKSKITYQYDKKLSIYEDDLEELNRIDFYHLLNWDKKLQDIVNNQFEVVVCTCMNVLKNLVDYYEGTIIYRALGSINGYTNTDLVITGLGLGYLRKIERLGERFVFSPAIKSISEQEGAFFNIKSAYVPYCIRQDEIETSRWIGEVNQLLFLCPYIKMSQRKENLYKQFIKEFEDIPYSFGGEQPISIGFARQYLGDIPHERYKELYKKYKVIFYKLAENEYMEPEIFLDAMASGIPVIYLQEDMQRLDISVSESSVGCCRSMEEAKRKIRSILRGNTRLIKHIQDSQRRILMEHSYDKCTQAWRGIFERMTANCYDTGNQSIKEKRLAILLPEAYTGGVLDYTIRLIRAIRRGAEIDNTPLKIIFGYIDNPVFEGKDYFKEIRNMGIEIRRFSWKINSKNDIDEVMHIMGDNTLFKQAEYCTPDDGISFFQDCDFILFTADRLIRPLYTLVPYGCILHDYIQRFVPEILGGYYEGESLDMARRASCCFTTTPSTFLDAVQYGGVNNKKVHQIPLFFASIPYSAPRTQKRKKYFVWSTNTNRHKKHKFALAALAEYYERGGTLKCYITGANTSLFSMDHCDDKSPYATDYTKEISNIIESNILLKKNLVIYGELSKMKYQRLLQGAAFFMHPGYADNGNGTAFDAAMMGVPTLSTDYPAMRNMADVTGIKMAFFEKDNVEELSELLLLAEKNYMEMAMSIPPQSELIKHTIDDDELCIKLFRTIKQYSGI